MICAQRFHQLILQQVDILKFINHNIFQTLLPFQADVFPLMENVKSKLDQVIIIQPEAFLFLIQIPVKDNILRRNGPVIFFLQRLQRQGDHVLIIIRLFEKLQDLNPVPRV